jgi:hypothetical protein
MNIDVNEKEQESTGQFTSNQPKHKQLIKMLTFRVVPAYYKEIEKVATHQNVSVSKLIRTYIKEGMKRDGELTDREDKEFTV